MRNAFFRRLSAVLIAALLLSTALVNAVAAEGEKHVGKVGSLHSAYDAQVVQDALYVLLEDKLVSISRDQQALTTILNFSDYPELNWYSTLLVSDGINLYALDPLTEAIYQINGSALEPIVTLDISGLGQEFEDGTQNVFLQYPVIQNGFLYALCMDFSDYSNDLYRFSLENGKNYQVSTDDYAFQELTAYREGQLLGLDFHTRNLVAIDATTGKAVDEIGASSGYSIGAIAYDSMNDRVYSLCDAELVRWENKKPVTIDYLAAGDASDALYVGIWQGQYSFVDRTGIYTCDTASAASKAKPLTIWSDVTGLLDSKQLSNFMKLYPQIPVVVRNAEDQNELEKISTASITGDTSIDIFAVSSQQVDGKEIFKRGYAARLDSMTLKDDVLSMYPQIQNYLTNNGDLFGFPAALWTKYWSVQPGFLEEAGFDAAPERIGDYYDMMLLWYEDNYNSHPTVTFNGNRTIQEEWREAIWFLTSQYVYTYASDEKPLSFNTAVFRAALEKVALLWKWKGEDTMRDYSEGTSKSIFQTNSMEPFVQNVNPESQGERYILPPAFAQAAQPILDTTLVYFIVNPYSQNQEAATRFLEFFSQNMELMLKYQLHPEENDLIEKPSYQATVQAYTQSIAAIKGRIASLENEEYLARLKDELEQEEAAFAQEEKDRWEYSAEAIAEYRKLAPYIRIEHSGLIWEICDSLGIETTLMKYFEGHATLDQALSELDRKVAMMFLEAQ